MLKIVQKLLLCIKLAENCRGISGGWEWNWLTSRSWEHFCLTNAGS